VPQQERKTTERNGVKNAFFKGFFHRLAVPIPIPIYCWDLMENVFLIITISNIFSIVYL